MFTKTLIASSLLALAPIASAMSPQSNQGPQIKPEGLVPFGDFSGGWISGSLLADGSLSGVLKDALGRPLWILDTKLTSAGQVKGKLTLLEYASNPAQGLGDLLVTGKSQVDADGAGSFSLIVYEPFAQIPGPLANRRHLLVKGTIRGQLKSGRLSDSGGSDDGAAGNKKPLRNQRADPSDSGLDIQGKGNMSSASASQNGAIYCPKGPDVSLSDVSKVANRAAAGIAPARSGNGSQGGVGSGDNAGQVRSRIIADPKAPSDVSVGGLSQSQGNVGQAGHQAPNSGAGKAVGRWTLNL